MTVESRLVDNEQALRGALDDTNWDAVLAGYNLAGFADLRALQIVREKTPELPFLLVSESLTHDIGVRAMRQGACDYLLPGEMQRLPPALLREIRHNDMRRQGRTTQTLYQDILSNAHNAIISVDSNLNIFVFSRGAESMFGYAADEVRGKSVNCLLPERYHGTHDQHMLDFMHRDTDSINLEERVSELVGLRSNGEEFRAEINISKSTDENGDTTFTAILRDISRRVATEQALRHSEMHLRELINNIKDYAIFMIDAQGCVKSWNPGAERLLGYPAEAIVGRHLAILFTEGEQMSNAPARLLEKARNDGWAKVKGWRVRHDGGTFYANNIITALLDDAGELTGYSYITGDISRQKYLEDMVKLEKKGLEKLVAERTVEFEQARHEAEQLAEAKSDFLADMSHEIRTPMNAVLGLAHLLEQQDLSDEAHDLTNKIQRSGEHLVNLINDILDFSRMENERLELEYAPFDLDEILENLSIMMAASASEKELELAISPPANLDCQLHGDAHRLRQVLINLTGNAIKFTEQGSVELKIEIVARHAARCTLKFSVRDTGIGISAEDQKKLFQPFTQANTSVSRRFGGSGLGLTISHHLVEMMGARLKLMSTPGKGSTFWFELDLDSSPWPVNENLQPQDINLMVVDDNLIAREGARATAESLGWKTREVSRGRDALHLISTEKSLQGSDNVVLLDWRLQDQDGLVTARQICDLLPEQQRPLLFLFTAQPRSKLKDNPDLPCVESILDKPLCPSSLYNAVNKAFNRRLKAVHKKGPPPRLTGLRLLVVDDSEINREVAQGIFSAAGAEVSLANNGQQALDWLNAHAGEVDLILMDVQMPIMNGYEATCQIRQTDRLAAIPIVALSAGAMRQQERKALNCGMDAFLPKPFDVDESIRLIRHLTGRDSATKQEHARQQPVHSAKDCNLDVTQGLKLWRSEDTYHRYLQKFACEYADVVRIIEESAASDGASLAHQLKGVAGNLSMPLVCRCAAQLEHDLQLGGSNVADLAGQLQAALDAALAAIASYVGEPDRKALSQQPITGQIDKARVGQQLSSVMQVLSNFDIVQAEPLVSALSAELSGLQAFDRLRGAVEDFDVSAALSACHEIARQFEIELDA